MRVGVVSGGGGSGMRRHAAGEEPEASWSFLPFLLMGQCPPIMVASVLGM
jgi:hypothetical protein